MGTFFHLPQPIKKATRANTKVNTTPENSVLVIWNMAAITMIAMIPNAARGVRIGFILN